MIGVCASYDVFLHWDDLWTSISSKVGGLSGKNNVKSNNDNSDTKLQNFTGNHSNQDIKSTSLNGMIAKPITNGCSKDKFSTIVAPSKLQKKGVRKEGKEPVESSSVMTAVFMRIGMT